jgi:hypothetical protein
MAHHKVIETIIYVDDEILTEKPEDELQMTKYQLQKIACKYI